MDVLTYKIDWLSFTIPEKFDIDENSEFKFLEGLGYDVLDFEELPNGKNFYNAGITRGNYVTVLYNDKQKENIGNQTSHNYVFTGQGCTELAKIIDSNWSDFFAILNNLDATVTRIDLALDDFKAVLDFEKMENKLNKGEYISSKKSFNVIHEKNSRGENQGYTIYIGKNSKTAKGCFFLRMYDKYAQYKTKGNIPPEIARETQIWQRYEIVFTKKKAQKVADALAQNLEIGQIFKSTMHNIVVFLIPGVDKKKTRWKVCPWYDRFLDGAEKARLGDPERDADLGSVLKWIRMSVVSSLNVLDEIFSEKQIDFYDVLKSIVIDNDDLSKKQKRLINESKNLNKLQLEMYLKRFKAGDL